MPARKSGAPLLRGSRWNGTLELMLTARCFLSCALVSAGLVARRAALYRQARLLLRRWARRRGRDVRPVSGPFESDCSVACRHDSRSISERQQFSRYTGRPRRLGRLFSQPRIRRLCRRSGGSSALAMERVRRRTSNHRHRRYAGASIHWHREIQPMAPGAFAHAMARNGASWRSRVRTIPCLAKCIAPDRFAPHGSNQSCRCRCIASEDRSGDRAHPFAFRHVRMGDRGRRAQPGARDRRR